MAWGDSVWGGAAWGSSSSIGVAIDANALVLQGVNVQASVSRLVSVQANPLILQGINEVSKVNLSVSIPDNPLVLQGINVQATVGLLQQIDAYPLILQGINKQATVGAMAVIPAYPLVSQWVIEFGTAWRAVIVDANPLVLQGINEQASVAQIHNIHAYPLISQFVLAVADSNYLAINFSIDNRSVTTLTGFNFIGACELGGKTLFINDNGLFVSGGPTQNGIPIIPSLKTGKINKIPGRNGEYASNKIKRIPDAKVYADCDKSGGSLSLAVTADTNTYTYSQAIQHDGFATHRIPIGRGIKFNYIQLELAGVACTSLAISSIEYTPVENTRSER